MIESEREVEMQAARCNAELVALIEAQARDARSTQWKHDFGYNDETGGALTGRNQYQKFDGGDD